MHIAPNLAYILSCFDSYGIVADIEMLCLG